MIRSTYWSRFVVVVSVILFLAGLGSTVAAQYWLVDPSFLQIQTDCRSRAMGEAIAALPDNPSGFMFNPACLVDAQHIFVQGSKARWWPMTMFDDMDIYSVAAGGTVAKVGSFGLAWRYFDWGSIEFTDEVGTRIGELHVYNMALYAGYAIQVHRNLALGANAKYIRVVSPDYGYHNDGLASVASSVGFDFGLYVFDIAPQLTLTGRGMEIQNVQGSFGGLVRRLALPRHHGLSFAVCVQNIGPGPKYEGASHADPLPRELRIGTAYRVFDTDLVGLVMAADVSRSLLGKRRSLSDEITYNLGGELNLYRFINVRLGYINDKPSKRTITTWGFGIGFDKIRGDIAYIPDSEDAGVLAKTKFIGLSANF